MKSAGNTSSVPNDAPLAAWVAEMPNSATSVAVSKPRPNRKPIGNRCQLLVTILNRGTKQPRQESAAVEEDVEVVLGERLAPLNRPEGPVDGDQDDQVEQRQ